MKSCLDDELSKKSSGTKMNNRYLNSLICCKTLDENLRMCFMYPKWLSCFKILGTPWNQGGGGGCHKMCPGSVERIQKDPVEARI